MGKVIGGMTMSLDGFVNDRHDSVAPHLPERAARGENERLRAGATW